METFRIGLIKWNIAPLIVVGAFLYFLWRVIEALIAGSCVMEIGLYTVLAGLATGLAGFVFKMYEYIQKNRGEDHGGD